LGSTPDPAGGAYSAPPDLAGLRGLLLKRGMEGEGNVWKLVNLPPDQHKVVDNRWVLHVKHSTDGYQLQ